MKNKRFSKRIAAAILSLALVLSTNANVTIVNAQTLAEAGKVEMTAETGVIENGRGYAGAGNQDKNRTESSVEVTFSLGLGADDSDWSHVTIVTPVLNKYGEPVTNVVYNVSDLDGDGDIDMTDFVKTIDADKVGTTELYYTSSDYGDFYMNFFGISTEGWTTYSLNGQVTNWGTPDLYDGDVIQMSLFDGYTTGAVFNLSDMPEGYPIERPSSGSGEGTEPTTTTPDYKTTYLTRLQSNVSSWNEDTALSDGSCYWQEMRILRFANGITRDVYDEKVDFFEENYVAAKDSQYDQGNLTAVNAMCVASVTGDTKYLDVLAHGFGTKDAATFDKAAGMYSVDYILMCLDLNNYATNEAMVESLADCADSESVRDDLIQFIVTTSSCWGGGWWTYDTGAQNAQAIAPYYNTYPEVKAKLDEFDAQAYANFMAEDYTGLSFDASSAAEYIRFLCILANTTNDYSYVQKALNVYNKINDIGIENTKYKGNGMDITRMSIAEWGLNAVTVAAPISGTTTTTDTNALRLFIDQVAVSSSVQAQTAAHIQANENISDVQIYEAVFSIPEELTVTDVTSAAGNIYYGVDGTTLRVVVSNLNGTALSILKDTDLVKISLDVSESGTYEISIVSSNFISSSEEVSEATTTSEEFEVMTSLAITATTLYSGATTSRFISADKKAVKVAFGKVLDIDGYLQLKVGDAYYDLFKTAEMSTDTVSVFVAILPTSVADTVITDAKNYFVATGDAKTVKFGDTDNDGAITSADALSIVRTWVGSNSNLTNSYILSANVDKDSDITNLDTMAVIENLISSSQFKVLQ